MSEAAPSKCTHCKKDIEPGATVCHQCGSNQSGCIYHSNTWIGFLTLILGGATMIYGMREHASAKDALAQANAALTSAEDAKTNADKAVTSAEDAVDRAKEASANAESANGQAEASLREAHAGMEKAEEALKNSKNAQDSAFDATRRADDALEKAEEALAMAKDANARAKALNDRTVLLQNSITETGLSQLKMLYTQLATMPKVPNDLYEAGRREVVKEMNILLNRYLPDAEKRATWIKEQEIDLKKLNESIQHQKNEPHPEAPEKLEK